MIAGLIACNGSTDVETQVPVATPGLTETATSQPSSRITRTTEPPVKVPQTPLDATIVTQFTDAPDRDLFRLTKELVPGSGDISRFVAGKLTEYAVGRTDTFWLVDLSDPETYQSEFELVLVTPHAYWYMENGLDLDLTQLERSASVFEEEIYPVVTNAFGSEWNPGVDNDSHLNILNANLSGLAGYFSSTDEYPIAIRPRSNQREIIYINAQSVVPGSATYEQVLAHELQHAIHWYADDSEDTWVNEGLAELSSSIALDSTSSIHQFLRASPTSLINWPTSSVGGIANYGAASLFMHYLTEHYGGQDSLSALLTEAGDSIAGVDAHLEQMGYESRFADVFREWAAANVLDGEGILGYDNLDVSARITGSIRGFNQTQSEIPQYAIKYTELKPTDEPFVLGFQGPTTSPLLPVDIGPKGCWWGNSGDSIDSTLSHRVQLPKGAVASLEYEVWFEIEKDWDYVYVEVSENYGKSWQIIKTSLSSPENPIGSGFGPGYTGSSQGWVQESIDLSTYAGEEIWVRFQYVTDDAVNAAGACFRNISIPAAGIFADDQDWEASGFVFTNNLVRQEFQVQLITTGAEPQVRQVLLDVHNTGEITVQPPEEGQKLIVAVGSLAEKTREPVTYTLTVSPAN
ncbi:MAG: immune inhibitor A [Dehalococcoidia bacterium]|nr:immune inhibitor A [Dehalococcoidia bacterium]